jgi:hypothetical protein
MYASALDYHSALVASAPHTPAHCAKIKDFIQQAGPRYEAHPSNVRTLIGASACPVCLDVLSICTPYFLMVKLYSAVEHGKVALVDQCVKAGASVTDYSLVGPGGKTFVPPLFFAKTNEIVDYLIAAGAKPDVRVVVDGKAVALCEANPFLSIK